MNRNKYPKLRHELRHAPHHHKVLILFNDLADREEIGREMIKAEIGGYTTIATTADEAKRMLREWRGISVPSAAVAVYMPAVRHDAEAAKMLGGCMRYEYTYNGGGIGGDKLIIHNMPGRMAHH